MPDSPSTDRNNFAPPVPLQYATADLFRRPSGAARVVLAIFIAVMVYFCAAPIVSYFRKGTTKDYPLWIDTGTRELHNLSPYYADQHGEFPFMYPPAAAGLLAIGSIFGQLPLMLLMVVVDAAAWAFCIFACVYLVTGKIRGQPLLLYWLPSLICVVFIWSTFLEGQPVVVLMACLLGMALCLRRNINWGAGLLLALAAGFKAFPILALPYLIWRRHYKAAAFTLVFLAVLLLAVPAIFRGPHGAWDDLHKWTTGMPSNYTETQIGQRKQRSYTWQNGSLISVTNRWLRHVAADTDDEYTQPLYINVTNLPFKTINKIIAVIGGLLCLGYLLVMPPHRSRTRFTNAAELGMLFIMINIFTPLSFTYLNSWLLLPLAVILYYIIALAPSRAHGIGAIVWLLLALTPLIFGAGRIPAFRIPRAMGTTFFTNLFLLAELAWMVIQQRAMNTGRAQLELRTTGETATPAT